MPLRPGRHGGLGEAVPLDQVAELMAEASWQRDYLASIKGKAGYRFFGLVLRVLSGICCGNLYASIGDQSSWLTRKIRLIDPITGGATLQSCTIDIKKPSTWRRSIRLSQTPAPLDEINERVFGQKRKCTPAIMLSRLMLVFCFCCELGITASTYFQYHHDYYQFHLVRLNTSQPLAGKEGAQWFDGMSYEQVLSMEEELKARERETRATVKIFGSFLMNRTYFCQCINLLLMLLCIFTYTGPLLYYRHKGSFDFHYLRLALDWDQEQANCNRMIVFLIQKFITSSENFSIVSQGRQMSRNLGFCFSTEPNVLAKDHGPRRRHDKLHQFAAIESCYSRSHSLAILTIRRPSLLPQSPTQKLALIKEEQRLDSSDTQYRAYSDQHKWVVGELKRLALMGRLQPLDRCKVEEMSWHMLIYSSIIVSVITSIYVWNTSLFTYLMPVMFKFDYELDLMDKVSMVELGTTILFMAVGATFYLSQVLICCVEQVGQMEKIKRKIDKFVSNNRRLVNGIERVNKSRQFGGPNLALSEESCSSRSSKELYESINSDLLILHMHYRIFATQLRPTRIAFGSVLLVCIALMVVFPIIGRLHMPYIRDRGSRILCIVICLIMILAPDIALYPLCRMNARCSTLCHSLWSLMAALAAIADHPKLGHLLNEHSVWLLRKELSHPDRLKSQSAIETLGIEFSYAEMLKLHFWLGLVLLSFIYDLASISNSSPGPGLPGNQDAVMRDTLIGNLFTDPLGIISGFKI